MKTGRIELYGLISGIGVLELFSSNQFAPFSNGEGESAALLHDEEKNVLHIVVDTKQASAPELLLAIRITKKQGDKVKIKPRELTGAESSPYFSRQLSGGLSQYSASA